MSDSFLNGAKPDVASMSPARALEALQEHTAVTLRVKGMSFEEIADHIGIAPGAAAKAYKRGLSRVRKETRLTAPSAIQEDLMRLELMIAQNLAGAIGGDPKAVAAVIQIMDRKAKLLGLDAAVKMQMEQPAAAKPVNLKALSPDELDMFIELSEKAGALEDESDD
jgi:hypothetical protein